MGDAFLYLLADLRVLFIKGLDHKGPNIRMPAHQAHLGFQSPKHGFKQVALLIAAAFRQLMDRHFRAGLPQKQIQLLFVVEIVKQQRFADARGVRNLAHGAFLVGILGKDPIAGVDNGLLLLLGERKEFLVHCRTSVNRCGQCPLYRIDRF